MRALFALMVSIACIAMTCSDALSSDANDLADSVRFESRAAATAYANANYVEAATHYSKAISCAEKLAPETKIVLLMNLGACHRENKDYDESEQAFKRALSVPCPKSDANLQKTRSKVMSQYAHLLNKMKRNSEAEAMELQAATLLAPPTSLASNSRSSSASSWDGSGRTEGSSSSGSDSGSDGTAPAADGTGANGKKLAMVPGSSTGIEKSLSGDKPNSSDKREAYAKMTVEQLTALAETSPDSLNVKISLASKLIKARNYEKTAYYLEQVAEHAPSNSSIQETLGMCYGNLGDYDRAIAASRRAVELEPRNETYMYNLVVAYASAGKMKGQLEASEKFVSRFPNSSYAPELKLDITRLQKVVEKTAETDLSKPSADEIAHSFAKHAMPLKVYIDEGPSVELQNDEGRSSHKHARELILKALDIWTQRSLNRVSFTVVSDAESSDIVLICTDQLEAVEPGAAGATTYHRPKENQNQIKALVVAKTGTPVKVNAFLSMLLHELGHALGLAHSSSAEDIMFWQERPSPPVTISNNDQRRIMQLYSN